MTNETILVATPEEIKDKIERLSSMADVDLKTAMNELKGNLLENPSAVQLLADEDIGRLVTAQRRMVGEAKTEAATKKTKAKKQPKLSSKPMDAADVEDILNSF